MSYDHKKLGISFAELGALLGTRALLAAQAMVHDEIDNPGSNDARHHFNMNIGCHRNQSCGSVSCIGGTMALIMRHVHPDEYVRNVRDSGPARLRNLFYPTDAQCRWDAITPDLAVKAIDQFLAGKPVHWKALTADIADGTR